MNVIIAIYIFIIGTIMGSFFNVVAHRLSNNESIIKPGSHCESCQHLLKWYELIPIISFLIQGGRCRQCHTKLSWWYPLIEIITGIFYLFSYLYFGLSPDFFISLVISSVLVITCITDFNYLIILDEPLVIGSILIIIITLITSGLVDTLIAILSGLLLFFFMLLVKILGDKAFKRESLGGGDIKLAFFIGCTLGLRLAFVSLIIASFLALPYASYYVVKKQEREIPFGPFLITGVLITFMLSNQIRFVLDLIMLAA